MGWEKRKIMPRVVTLIVLMICNEGYGQESVLSHLRYNSEINHRYAVTWVTAHMKNPSNSSTELLFKMTLPKNSFISGLIMEVEGRNYTSRVEDKKVAKETYNEAKKHGNHAGLVEQSGTTEQQFQVSTNVEARGKVIFYLKYEELLLRSKGKYTQNIQIKPGKTPSKLDVTVHIKESVDIMDLEIVTTPLGPHGINGNNSQERNSNATHIHKVSSNEAVVQYYSQGPEEGLYGELTLTYDVKREKDGGDIQVSGEYFVHFFSPDGLPKMPAHTVFILDISGSMAGEKLLQLKQSMLKIFEDLKPEDSFELLTFHSDVTSLGVYNASNPMDMKNATEEISNLHAQGSTNINAALIMGFENVLNRSELSANQVVFLTDGRPVSGVTTLSAILKNVIDINKKRIPLYSLALGYDADLKFLNKISFHNRGFARQIPVDSNTAKILQGFYKEIGTPLMTDINIQYPEEAVDQATIVKKGWSTLQSGNEVIVAGKLKPGAIEVHSKVDGITKTGSHQFKVSRVSNTTELTQKENFIERLWAYLNIQDLLNTAEQTDDADTVEELKARARSLALKHSFVTKLTSLVVVRPEDLPSENSPIDEDQTEESIIGKPQQIIGYQQVQIPIRDSHPIRGASINAFGPPAQSLQWQPPRRSYSTTTQRSSTPSIRAQSKPNQTFQRTTTYTTTSTSPTTPSSSSSSYSITTQRSSTPSITAQTKPKFCKSPYEEVGSQCLYIGETEATWPEAQENCQNLNGSLAEITQELKAVINFLKIKAGPLGWAWMGRTNVSDHNTWLRSQTPVGGHWAELPNDSYDGCLKLGVEEGGYKPHHCMNNNINNYLCEITEKV